MVVGCVAQVYAIEVVAWSPTHAAMATTQHSRVLVVRRFSLLLLVIIRKAILGTIKMWYAVDHQAREER